MLYPKNIESKLNFEKIRTFLSEKCRSKSAVDKVQSFRFISDYNSIVQKLKLSHEMKNILLFEDYFPAGFFPDSGDIFSQKEQEGSYFRESELMELKASLENVKRLTMFFRSEKNRNYPTLKSLLPQTTFINLIVKSITDVIDRGGTIKDNASPQLKQIRNDLSVKKSSISKSLARIISQAESAGIVESGVKPAMREGKLLIPVNSSYKRKIKGVVYDVSTSGQTSYIEPLEVMDLNNDIRTLEMAEKQEMIRILTELTEEFRPYFGQILKTYTFLFEIDFIQAKAKLAIELDAVMPDVHPKPFTKFKQAGHPLLIMAYKDNKEKEVIKSDIFLTKNKRLMVISGPNAGGKSVSLKTAGMLQYMLQCGLLIPVKQISEVGIYKSIFLDIGDEQSVENDLSTYSSHLLNMKNFTEKADSESLILIDEMGSGTEPHLGGAIAEAVLEELAKKKVRGIITTHYANLKAFAENTEGAFNAAMLFDRENLKPLYMLEAGKPGSSFAFEIAKKTGLSDSIMKAAKEKTDSTSLDFEEILRKTMKEKRILRRTKRKIQDDEKEIASLKAKYEKAAEFIYKEKKKILNQAKKDAEDILAEANKKIENTIYKIKKVQANKEETKKLRLELESFKKELENDIDKKQQKLTGRIKNVSKNKTKKEQISRKPAQLGDFVKIKGQNSVAQVIELKNKKAVVIAGNIRMTVTRSDLAVVNAPKKQKTKGGIHLIKDEENTGSESLYGIDVRGNRAEEALRAVRQYIDNSLITRTIHLKILHGTGTGVLREVIREFLSSSVHVKNFKDERIEMGGAGITLVELDF